MSSKEMKPLGLVDYKGKWITYDKMMKAKGMVQFEGQWVTRSEKKKLEAYTKKVEALAKQFPFKGVLDKPGADHENLPWEEARAKETDHFIVRANLSINALNDICFLMECAYFIWQDFFGFPEPKEKLKVFVPKNRDEFEKIYRDLIGKSTGTDGLFIPKETPSNKAHEDHLVTHYDPARKIPETMLFHEGTHYAVALVVRARGLRTKPPTWFNEGWATCYEAGKSEGERLVTNLINQNRLTGIKKTINNNTYIKLKDFINRPQSEYDFAICYPEGWSLVYFLLNGKGGKYKQRFKAYIKAWKKGKIDMQCDGKDVWIQDKAAHIKVFEKAIGIPIDQLEKEWKEYILKLK